jgi:DNA invertase Pin-like site-specific DNA recombinase
VNPEHLRVGTQRENMADMDARGRRWSPFTGQVQVGSRNRNARLDEAQVAVIKARLLAGEEHAPIAAEYGVHRATVSQIARGKSWAHVHAEPSRARVSPWVTIEAG